VTRWLLPALVVAACAVPAAALAATVGTDDADLIIGTAGADSLFGLGGNDSLSGGDGNDDLDGGAGADDIRGGLGDDAVSYAAGSGVTVTLDNRANDGMSGEGDNVHTDVEDVYGSPGADELVGSRAINTLDAGDGDDTLQGGSGADYLYGGGGNDILDARDGTDDFVDCGLGHDAAIVDDFDMLVGCEVVGTTRRAFGDVTYLFARVPSGVVLQQFALSGLFPVSARIEIACHGKGCPLRSKRFQPRTPTLDLSSLFAGRPLQAGVTIEIRITAPQAIGKFVEFTVTKKAMRKSRSQCLRPGRRSPVQCPR
jgi:hypothetical protein